MLISIEPHFFCDYKFTNVYNYESEMKALKAQPDLKRHIQLRVSSSLGKYLDRCAHSLGIGTSTYIRISLQKQKAKHDKEADKIKEAK